MAESGEENDGSKKPQPPPKTRAVAIKSRPSKPAGIKGWGRHRVGVGVPVKKEDDSEGAPTDLLALCCCCPKEPAVLDAGLEAWARIQAERDANRPAVVKPIKRKGWGVAVARIEQFRASVVVDTNLKAAVGRGMFPPTVSCALCVLRIQAGSEKKGALEEGLSATGRNGRNGQAGSSGGPKSQRGPHRRP
jgi:hypothetical protein